MDKDTLSQYGWIVVTIIILAILIGLATPFAASVRTSIETTVNEFKTQLKATMNNFTGTSSSDDSDGSEGSGGGGSGEVETPKVQAPQLTVDGDMLTITDTSGKADSYLIYSGEVLVGNAVSTGTNTTFSLAGLDVGTHTLKVVAKADGMNDSDKSTVYYTKLETLQSPALTIENETLVIVDSTQKAETYDVYVGDELLKTVTAVHPETTVDLSGLDVGEHDVSVVAKATDMKESNKVSTSYTKLATLDTPTLSVSGDVLSITDNSGKAEGYDIYNGSTLITTLTKSGTTTMYDLSGLAVGNHSIGVVAKATGMKDSTKASASYTKLATLDTPTLSINNETLTITDASGKAKQYAIYDGNTLITTVTSVGTTTTVDLSGFTVGTHTVGVVAKANNMNDSARANVNYEKLGTVSTPTLTVNDETLVITDAAGEADTYDIYDGATWIATVPAAGTATAYNLKDLAVGTHTIGVVAKADNMKNSAKVTVAFKKLATLATPTLAVDDETLKITDSTGKAQSYSVYDGDTLLGTVVATKPTTSYDLFELTVGTHSIKVVAHASEMKDSAAANTTFKKLATLDTPTLSIKNETLTIADLSAKAERFEIYDGNTLLATVTSNGTTTDYSLALLAPGTHTISVVAKANDMKDSNKVSTEFTMLETVTAPSLSVNDETLVIADDSGKAEIYDVYDGINLIKSVNSAGSKTNVDLSGLSVGTHNIKVVAKAENMKNSAEATVSFTKLDTVNTPALSVNGETLVITDNSGEAETYDIYDGANLIKTVVSAGTTTNVNLSGLSVGSHTIKVVAKADGRKDSEPVTTSFKKLDTVDGPVLSVNGETLTITDNAGKATKYEIYDGNTKVATISSNGKTTTYDLSDLSVGTHTIGVVGKNDNMKDSNKVTTSFTKLATVSTPVLSIVDDVLNIKNTANDADEYEIYNGTTLITTVASQGVTTTYELYDLPAGTYQIAIIGKADNCHNSAKATISHTVADYSGYQPDAALNFKTLTINHDDNADEYKVLVNGTEFTTVTSNGAGKSSTVDLNGNVQFGDVVSVVGDRHGAQIGIVTELNANNADLYFTSWTFDADALTVTSILNAWDSYYAVSDVEMNVYVNDVLFGSVNGEQITKTMSTTLNSDIANGDTAKVELVFNGVVVDTETLTVSGLIVDGYVELSDSAGTIATGSTGKITVTQNASGGKLNAVSSDTSIATVKMDGNTVVITATSKTGEAVITVTSAATEGYTEASATYTVTVKKAEAYAVYSADDSSLMFYKVTDTIEEGEVYNNKTATKVYTDIETDTYATDLRTPWYGYKSNITKVEFVNEVTPKSVDYWFYGLKNCTSFDLANLNTEKLTSMESMFASCSSVETLDVSGLNTSNVTDMTRMFTGCSKLKSIDISDFNTDKVTAMSHMFYNCKALNSVTVSDADGGINTSKVTNMSNMFYGCSSLVNLDLSDITTSAVKNMSFMFANCSALKNLDVSTFVTTVVTNMNSMFYGCAAIESVNLSSFNTSNVTDMGSMFRGAAALKTLDLSGFNVGKVETLSDMFNGCSNLTTIKLFGSKANALKYVSGMFYGCQKLTALNLSNFNTSQVTSFTDMFRDCKQLTTLDLTMFDTALATDMKRMFYGCSNLGTLNVSSFNTSNVDDMDSMFYNCAKLSNLNITNFDTSKVENMTCMFYGCTGLTSLDLSLFETSKVIRMQSMFYGCSNLVTIYASELWSTEAVTYGTSMFSNCTKLVGAMAYNSSRVSETYANYVDGYLTYKAIKVTTPTLTVNDEMLTITDAAGAAEEYDIYNGDTLLATIQSSGTTTVYDLSGLEVGTHTIGVVGKADGLKDSEKATVSFTKLATVTTPTLSIADDVLTITNNANDAETYEIYNGTTLITTITSAGVTTQYDLSDLPDGAYELVVIGKADGKADSERSAGLTYTAAPAIVSTPNIRISDNMLIITNGKMDSETYEIYNGTTLIDVIASAGITTTYDLSDLPAGTYQLAVVGKADGKENSAKVTVGYTVEEKQPVCHVDENGDGKCDVCSEYILNGIWTFNETPNLSSSIEQTINFISCEVECTAISVEIDGTDAYLNYTEWGYPDHKFEMYETPFGLEAEWRNDEYRTVDFGTEPQGVSEKFYKWFKANATKQSSGAESTQNGTTYAVYSADDNSLTFYKTEDVITQGSSYNNKKATAVYTGFEDEACITAGTPWYGYREDIKSVVFADEITPTNTRYWFSNLTVCETMDLKKLNTKNVTNMGFMFENCTSLKSLDLSYFNTSNVTDMTDMFKNCSSLTSLDVSTFNTSKVTSMSCMFYLCSSLTNLDVTSFDTSKVQSMLAMFYGCKGLTTLDLSSFRTNNVEIMHLMFAFNSNLKTIYVSELWSTSSVKDGDNMFFECMSLERDTSYGVGNFRVNETYAHYGDGGYLTYKAA